MSRSLTGPEPAPGRPIWRRAITWCGVGLTFAAFAFILHQVATTDWSNFVTRGHIPLIMGTAAAALIYGAAGILLAIAWWRLLVASFGQSLPLFPVLATYATTQAYKYLPSNVLHLVGRHVLLKTFGVSHSALLSAAGIEIAALLTSAGLLSAVTGWQLLVEFAAQGTWFSNVDHRFLLLLPGVVTAGAIAMWLRRDLRRLVQRHVIAVATALLLYSFFFLISGLILLILLCFALGLTAPNLFVLLAITTTAWIVGFLVPGAPAGIGVREAIIILLMEPTFGQANALALATLYRVATIGGDGLFATAGLAMQRLVVK